MDKQIFDISSSSSGGHAVCRLDKLTDAAPPTKKEGDQAVIQLPKQDSTTAPSIESGWDLFGGAMDGYEAPPSSSLTAAPPKSSAPPTDLTEGDLDLDDFL